MLRFTALFLFFFFSSIASADLPQPICKISTLAGAYRFQQSNRIGEIWLFKNATYKVYELQISGNKIQRVPAETGTYKFIWGCAAQLHIDGTPLEQVWPVYFSRIKIINNEKVPHGGFWMDGDMERIIDREERR